jgi:hypothetical protein
MSMPQNRPRIPAEVERQVLVEAGHRCAVCGVELPVERAHIVPWSRSKDHSAENLICLCANCHERSHKENWSKAILRDYKRQPWVIRARTQEGASIGTATMADDFSSQRRPRVIVKKFFFNLEETETGEEYYVEAFRVLNVGKEPAVSIRIESPEFLGRAVQLREKPPAILQPGDEVDVEVRNLEKMVDSIKRSQPGKPVKIPLRVEYRDLNNKRWSTDHAIEYTIRHGITIEFVHPDEPPEWTDLAALAKATSRN